ncbi:MAG: hypothetical protein M3680_15725 [Myxococcota bacterium]|nr:hypothetical protein [Myxococcota bacterium]
MHRTPAVSILPGLLVSALVAVLPGCAIEEADEVAECACGLGTVCLEGVCVAPSPDGKFDLPNGALYEGPHDGTGYAAVASFFANQGFDLTADVSQLQLAWPTRQAQTAALNRFGTPILLAGRGYFHTALDVMRPAPTDNPDVLAPVSGTAFVFDWYGSVGYHGNPYAAVVAIWDPRSKTVTQLMHVEPAAELLAVGQGPLEVTQGQRIGTLALVPLNDPTLAEGFRHTHVDIVDGKAGRALDPSRHLPYQDHVAPVAGELYLLDAAARKSAKLSTGKLDVVVQLSDRDDHSARNFEVAAISYTISLDGVAVATSPRCELDHLIEKIGPVSYATGTLSLLDLGNASAQVGIGGWPQSDIDNRDRTFRYALTQFSVVDRRCVVRPDADGYIDVPATAGVMTVRVTAWDRNGNATTTRRTLRR